ncbi:MAG: fumarylacetoacetate hydrolase family protein [Brevundimonas sp.]|nr:fumarylacetoacetate hydrolase family protein [Brevundimonas sp.]MCZ8322595.1 fumarylacetoacetate hydrolase family protein [Novosphingobium sp.]
MPVQPVPAIPIVGSSKLFPVRRIWCVGRNYAEHAREMGSDPTREPPFFFAKPGDAVVPLGGTLPYPPMTQDLHHEVELAVAIGKAGRNLSPQEASGLVLGYAVALDMTRRDLQAEAKRTARPWDMAKGFDQSCPISAITPDVDREMLASARISLSVNGVERQTALIGDMIWSVEECLAALSQLVELLPGDLLLTGTPAGVAPVIAGEQLYAVCEGIGELRIEYQA